MTTKIMPVTDLRRQTSDVIRSVQRDGDTVYITQHGRPAVVLIGYEQYEALIALLGDKRPAIKQKQAVSLLQSWIDEGDSAEQTATANALITGLDESRTSDRPLFPAELEGQSW